MKSLAAQSPLSKGGCKGDISIDRAKRDTKRGGDRKCEWCKAFYLIPDFIYLQQKTLLTKDVRSVDFLYDILCEDRCQFITDQGQIELSVA